ncbi:MAG: transposase [Methanobacteriaceae archaeon]|nr:transposase [Methanobacteriaceae archaeon]
MGVQNTTNSRRTLYLPGTKNIIKKNPEQFKLNGTGLQGVNCKSYFEFSPTTKAHELSKTIIQMRIMNMSNDKGIELLNKAINNINLTTNYAQSILIEKQMSETKFREKTIHDLDNENLTQNEKIQKISKRCNREELTNIRKIDRIKRDKLLENVNKEEIVNYLNKEKRLNIVLDNYRVHKTKLVQKIAEILNINLIFLPPYSPDLNPIEDVWRKIKGIISINNYNNVEDLKKAFEELYKEIIKEPSFYKNWIQKFTQQ